MRGHIVFIVVMLSVLDLSAQTKKTVKDLFEEPGATPSASPEVSRSATGSAGTPKVIAEVNGQEISQAEFIKIMYKSAGARIVRQLMGVELARQMAVAERVQPTKADFDAEYRTVVKQLGPEKDNLGRSLTFEDHERLLRGILQRRGMCFEEFQVGIQKQAYLRAVARKRVNLTEDMLRKEFDRTYGRKRRVRAIMLQDLKLAEDVFHRLQKGEGFAKLASKYSIDFNSAPIGGQIGEICQNDPKYPPLFVKTVFNLGIDKFSSPIKVNGQFWIIKIDQEVPPVPISFEKVRPELSAQTRTRLENQMMEKLQVELFRNARIKVYDRLLSKEVSDWIKELQTNEQ